MRAFAIFLFASFAFTGSACKTQFFGEAKVPGGANGCRAICQNLGMDLAGMVVMGEYSNGCICQVAGQPAASADGEEQDSSQLIYVGANGAAAAAGVAMQSDDDEEAAEQNK